MSEPSENPPEQQRLLRACKRCCVMRSVGSVLELDSHSRRFYASCKFSIFMDTLYLIIQCSTCQCRWKHFKMLLPGLWVVVGGTVVSVLFKCPGKAGTEGQTESQKTCGSVWYCANMWMDVFLGCAVIGFGVGQKCIGSKWGTESAYCMWFTRIHY